MSKIEKKRNELSLKGCLLNQSNSRVELTKIFENKKRYLF